MNFKWNIEKNKLLKEERGICFEDVVNEINSDNIIDIVFHPKQDKYPNQKLYILKLLGYVHMVPFVKHDNEIFLKTIIPSRKLNKLYKGVSNADG